MKKISMILILAIALVFSTANAQKKSIPPAKGGTTTTTTTTTTTQDEKTGKKSMPAAKDTKKGAKETTQSSKMTGKKPIKGVVTSLNKVVQGNAMSTGTLSDGDQPVVLMVGKGKSAKLYFIYNSDGTFGGKKLMGFGAGKTVGVVGKTKVINGINIIFADVIDVMK